MIRLLLMIAGRMGGAKRLGKNSCPGLEAIPINCSLRRWWVSRRAQSILRAGGVGHPRRAAVCAGDRPISDGVDELAAVRTRLITRRRFRPIAP